MSELVDEALAPERFSLLLMECLGALALFLALVGVYGVISFSVAQRTREFGVRMALGQAPAELRRTVVAQALKVILPSIALGIVVAALSTRFLNGLLYGVHPLDPATFIIVPLGLIVVATLACDAPARKASRVDPLVALRDE
jgi:ABC-type antimicrobial peptide transport system permease subunit